ncbi:MAG TPA: hypothetical protein VF577_01185 [Allosphingosinicella sp.]|jgi:hypothetical protein
MRNIAIRFAAAGALLAALAQAGGESANAQQGWNGARYAAIGRDAEMVLLLDQQQGIIYQCPIAYRTRCFERSRVGD